MAQDSRRAWRRGWNTAGRRRRPRPCARGRPTSSTDLERVDSGRFAFRWAPWSWRARAHDVCVLQAMLLIQRSRVIFVFPPKFGRTRAKFSRIRPSFGRMMTKFGRFQADLGRCRPPSPRIWSTSADSYPNLAKLAQTVDFGPTSARHWSNLADSGPDPVEFRPTSVELGQHLTDSGSDLAGVGRLRPQLCSTSAPLGPGAISSRFGRVWRNGGQEGSARAASPWRHRFSDFPHQLVQC